MVVVPAGQFRMSSSREEAGRTTSEIPQRLVEFPRPFAISRYPVTRGQFRTFLERTRRTPAAACSDATPARRAGLSFMAPGFAQTDEHPAVCVGHEDAVAYVEWLNRELGISAYRLPTEAEWEYVARSGSRSAYTWGEDEKNACRYGNFGDSEFARKFDPQSDSLCSDGFAYTAPVGSFPANAWGVLDTVGNVRQWTRSCLHDVALRNPEAADAWLKCTAMAFTLRGAGFATRLGVAATRVATRTVATEPADVTTSEVGFRTVRSL